MIGSLIVGALIGMMAGAITKKGESMGCVYNIFAGLVGQSLFGYWGPTLADMAILPSVLGAIIVIAVVDLFFG